MSASPNTTGAVLGAGTTAGFLASGITSWQIAALIAAGILALGLLLIFIVGRKRKKEDKS